MQPILGIVVLVGLVWLLSENRPAVGWRMVLVGIVIQLVLALLLLRARTEDRRGPPRAAAVANFEN